MSLDTPSGSVSGRQGWEWNRLMDSSRAKPSSTLKPSTPSSTPHQRIEALEAQVRWEHHRTQAIIDKYERLLEERNRQLRLERTGDAPSWLRRLVDQLDSCLGVI